MRGGSTLRLVILMYAKRVSGINYGSPEIRCYFPFPESPLRGGIPESGIKRSTVAFPELQLRKKRDCFDDDNQTQKGMKRAIKRILNLLTSVKS